MIVPALIPRSYEEFAEEVGIVQRFASVVQVDVMNGTYAPGTSWPYAARDEEDLQALVTEAQGLPFWEKIEYGVDLLLKDPLVHFEEWLHAGVSRGVVHLETAEDTREQLFLLAERFDAELAVALKPSTDNTLLGPWIERGVAFVQCMGNDKIGFHGVELDPTVLGKIADIHTRWPEVTIGVDIGVSKETIPLLKDAGASRFAAGSAILSAANPEAAFLELSQLST